MSAVRATRVSGRQRAAVELDGEMLVSLLRLRDDHGVLSVYVDVDPELQSAPRPGWQVAVANELRALAERVKAEGPRERRVALGARLDGLGDELERLLESSGPGRGRALFAPLAGDEVVELSLQLPLPTQVVLDDSAYVRPLVAALEGGRATGLVTVSRDGVRVLDWRLGTVEELLRLEFEQETGEWRELKGPAAANPGVMQQMAPQRERFERRLDDHRRRFLQKAGERLDGLAAAKGWRRLLVAGEPSLRVPLLEATSRAPELELCELDARLDPLPASDLAGAVAGELARSDLERHRSLAIAVRDRALAGGAASLGLRETLSALEAGRVAVLVLDQERDVAGTRTPDGRLSPAGEVPPATTPSELVLEPHLVERMIERAFETGAEVVPLDPDAAGILASESGIGALLRW